MAYRKAIAGTIALLFALLLFAGCGGKADISAYENTPIAVSGLAEQEFTVTPKDLTQLTCVSMSAEGATDKAGKVTTYGPTLETFLAQYGKTPADFDRIRFIGADEYRVVLYDDDLAKYKVYFSVASGGKPLVAEEQPLRILVPGMESSKWARMIVRMEFVPAKTT